MCRIESFPGAISICRRAALRNLSLAASLDAKQGLHAFVTLGLRIRLLLAGAKIPKSGKRVSESKNPHFPPPQQRPFFDFERKFWGSKMGHFRQFGTIKLVRGFC